MRGAIQESMLTNLKLKLEGSGTSNESAVDIVATEDGVHALAISLQLRDVALPEQYKNAVAEKQSAEGEYSYFLTEYITISPSFSLELFLITMSHLANSK